MNKGQQPQTLHNVLVLHTVLGQGFWTRGFLCGDGWHVMTWNGAVTVPKESIRYWTDLPIEKN